jgi:hypothetical protein
MKHDLFEIMEVSKKRISKTFFRIVKSDNSYVLREYVGPTKSIQTMMCEGWNRHTYLTKYINEDYPVFNLNDFKSNDGFTIEKKTNEDFLKGELLEIIEYYNLNQNLFNYVKEFKKIANNLSGNTFLKFERFSDYYDSILKQISILNVPNADKVKYQSTLTSIINKIYLELDKLNIEKSRLVFENKFKYFLSLIKE